MKEKTHFTGDDPLARIAALEAENAELKRVTFDPRVLVQMNALESERDTLRQQLATAREALTACKQLAAYPEDICRITKESIAAIGDAFQKGE